MQEDEKNLLWKWKRGSRRCCGVLQPNKLNGVMLLSKLFSIKLHLWNYMENMNTNC